jgi:uncharacterized protein with von Willebrand factor type A (vWA) domain
MILCRRGEAAARGLPLMHVATVAARSQVRSGVMMTDIPDPEAEARLQSLIDKLASELQETPIDVELDLDSIGEVAPPEAPASPTALVLDDWSMRRGSEWAAGEALKSLEKIDKEIRDNVAADMLSAAWEPRPQLVDKCEDPKRLEYLSALLASPEYQSLHKQTKLDTVASELAALKYAQGYAEYAAMPEPESDLEREAQAAGAAAGAAREAGEEIEGLSEARRSLGGVGDIPGQSMNVEEVKRLYNKIRGNKTLRRIMEVSGRYRRMAKALQMSKPVHGNDETIGIELDNDLSRIVASELVSLSDELLEYDFLRRFTEKQLMVRETKSVESETRGPLVIVVDESGSMHGEPVENAKAMALSILWIAEHQKRWACLVGFAGNTEGNFLVVPPGKRDVNAIMDWLIHFYSGGTTMDVPLDVLPKRWKKLGCPQGRTDIIQITDAFVDVPPKLEKSFLAWKAENDVKMNTIVIGSDPGDLARVSDRVWKVNELNLDADGIAECLSI